MYKVQNTHNAIFVVKTNISRRATKICSVPILVLALYIKTYNWLLLSFSVEYFQNSFTNRILKACSFYQTFEVISMPFCIVRHSITGCIKKRTHMPMIKGQSSHTGVGL